MKKYAILRVTGTKKVSQNLAKTAAEADGLSYVSLKEALGRVASSYSISAEPEDYVVAVARAVTADKPNENGDAFSEEELLRFEPRYGCRVYETFKNKPLHVQHRSEDPLRARGFIIDAHYNNLNPEDKFVEVIIAVDRKKDPLLASSVENGQLRSFSMGCDCRQTCCNVCGNVAYKEADFCTHIQPSNRMRMFASGDGSEKKAFEWCQGVTFEELSVVGTPADPQALTQELLALKSELASLQQGSRTVETETIRLAAELNQKVADLESRLGKSDKIGDMQELKSVLDKKLSKRMEERKMATYRFANIYRKAAVAWKDGFVVVSNAGKEMFKFKPAGVKVGSKDILFKVMESIGKEGMAKTARAYSQRKVRAGEVGAEGSPFKDAPKSQKPLDEKKIPFESKPDKEGYEGDKPKLRPEGRARALRQRALRERMKRRSLRRRSLRRNAEDGIDPFANPPKSQLPLDEKEIPFESDPEKEGYAGDLADIRAARLRRIKMARAKARLLKRRSLRRRSEEVDPFKDAPKSQKPLDEKKIPFESKPDKEGYEGDKPKLRPEGRAARLQALRKRLAMKKRLQALKSRKQAQPKSVPGGVTDGGKDDLRSKRPGVRSNPLQDQQRDLRSPRPKERSLSNTILEDRMTDRRASLLKKVEAVRKSYAKLAERKAQLMAKKMAEENKVKWSRALVLAATRQMRGIDKDGCELKASVYDVLTTKTAEYEGMDGDLALALIESAFDQRSTDAFVSDLVGKAGKLMDMNAEAFTQLEADAKNVATVPVYVEPVDVGESDSREASVEDIKEIAKKGNLSFLKSSGSAPAGGKRQTISSAINKYNVGGEK